MSLYPHIFSDKFLRSLWSRGQILRSHSWPRDVILVLTHLGLVASTMCKVLTLLLDDVES